MPIYNKRANWLIIILLSVTLIHSKANLNHLRFGFANHKESVTIPFISYNNIIIIESVIDDKNKLNLILDTGIRSFVLFNKSYIPKVSDYTVDIKFTGTSMLKPVSALVSTNHNLRLCDDIVANKINAVILNRSNEYLHKLKGIKIHGVFGYQLFSRFQVKIDYKNQLFTISEPYKTNVPEGFEAIPILIHDAKPFIDAHIFTMESKWQKLRLILDLGANHKILLQNNSNTSKKTISNQKNAKGLGGSIFGIKTHAKSNRLGSIYYYNLAILIPTNNSYHRESMDIEKHASLGGRLFKKSIIVLDYINGN